MRNWSVGRGCGVVLAVVLLAGAGGSGGSGQTGGQNNGGTMTQPGQPAMGGMGADSGFPRASALDPSARRMEAAQERAVREDRHKRMVEDTARLVELSNELKADVDKAGKDQLSLAVVNKAGEIEKLAHDVKERMKE